ncbi:MAG: Ig-like domain-containing protein, partial [Gemmatimonadaceae bacterium]
MLVGLPNGVLTKGPSVNIPNKAVLTALLLAAIACGGTESNKNGADLTDLTSVSSSLPVTETVEVSPASASLGVGARFKFASNFVDKSGAPVVNSMASLTRWESSDTTVATVSPTGIVTGRRSGSAFIRALFGQTWGAGVVTIGAPQVPETGSATPPAATTPASATPATPAA